MKFFLYDSMESLTDSITLWMVYFGAAEIELKLFQFLCD
jgi:hypothetical protein